MRQGKYAFFYLALAGLASWAALAWIFPRLVDVYWPQHGDFYTPASIANLRLGLIHYRPVGIFLDTMRGSLGVRLSILVGHLTVILNAALVGLVTALLSDRPQSLSGQRAIVFLTYALLLFSHPYFFTFSLWDFYSQAALTFTLLAILVYLTPRFTISLYGLFALLATLSFLTKETYGLSFIALLALKRFDKSLTEWPERRALICAALVVGGFALALIINRALNSPFIAGSAEAVAPYRLSLQPLSVLAQWWTYLLVGYGKTIWLIGLSLGVLAFLGRRLAWNGGALVIAGLMAWLPNSLLPNHYFAGYSWDGATLLFAPIALLGQSFLQRQIPDFRSRLLSCALVLASVWGFVCFKAARVANRSDNAWVLEQMNRQKHFYGDLIRLLRERGSDHPERFLLSGITFTFTPLEFPGSFLPERNAAQIHLFAVRYGHGHELSWREGERLSYVAVAEANPQDFDEVWTVHENGSIDFMIRSQTETLRSKIPRLQLPLYPDLIQDTQAYAPISSFDSFLQEAQTLRRYREFREAKNAFCRALKLRPDDANTWFNLALTLANLGEDASFAGLRAITLLGQSEDREAWTKALREASGKDVVTTSLSTVVLSNPCP